MDPYPYSAPTGTELRLAIARQVGALRVVGRSVELRLRAFALLSTTEAVVPPASCPSR